MAMTKPFNGFRTPGNRDIPLGDDFKMKHMEIFEVDCDMPMTREEFNCLSHRNLEYTAPHPNDMKKQNGMCKFQVGYVWYIGMPVSRRRMKCWKASFPPEVAFKDPASMKLYQGACAHFPELRMNMGTMVAGKLMTIALNAASPEMLRAWLKFKEETA